jgi:transposase-like protein
LLRVLKPPEICFLATSEPYRVCRRLSILRECSDDKLKYTPEIRERAVQLLIESEKDYPSNWAAITAIAPKIGCTPETLRAWHQKHLDEQNPIKVQQISDQEKMKQMEREIKELKRANEILRKAAAFFAQAELDRPHK